MKKIKLFQTFFYFLLMILFMHTTYAQEECFSESSPLKILLKEIQEQFDNQAIDQVLEENNKMHRESGLDLVRKKLLNQISSKQNATDVQKIENMDEQTRTELILFSAELHVENSVLANRSQTIETMHKYAKFVYSENMHDLKIDIEENEKPYSLYLLIETLKISIPNILNHQSMPRDQKRKKLYFISKVLHMVSEFNKKHFDQESFQIKAFGISLSTEKLNIHALPFIILIRNVFYILQDSHGFSSPRMYQETLNNLNAVGEKIQKMNNGMF